MARNRQEEISMASMAEVEEIINSTASTRERAPQKPHGFSRNITTDIQRVVSFQSPQEVWDSLPMASKLFMLATFVDVLLVIGYSLWQFMEMADIIDSDCDDSGCTGRREHLHVILSMLVSAIFWVIFVIDAISQENDFELLACIFLTLVMAARVTYFVLDTDFSLWATVTGVGIVALAASITTVFAFMTYRKFGWRIYSRLACDLRLKNAAERTLLYFEKNRFTTLAKLDFQFLVLTCLIGIVMSAKEDELSIKRNNYTVVLLICTIIGFISGLIWLFSAVYTIQQESEKKTSLLGLPCLLTFIFPIAAVVAVYLDDESHERTAIESFTISTGILVVFRLLVCKYMKSIMSLLASKEGKSEKLEDKLMFRMSSKHPDLLPLLKGSWLIKQSPSSPNKRRFFQLSQDYTSLRWAWNRYVLLYYVERFNYDDDQMTITLCFEMEPDLVMKFEDVDEFETWRRGCQVVLALLLSPDSQVENRSRIIFANRPKAKVETQGLAPLDAFMKRFGITSTRHHTHGSTHPEKEARRQLRKIRSGGNQTTGEDEAKQMITTQDSNLTSAHNRQSARIPSAKMAGGCDPLTFQQSLESQGTSVFDSSNAEDLNSPQEDPTRLLLHDLHMSIESIEYSDLEFGKLLGSGAEGAVWAAWYLDTPVAVKKTDSANEQNMIMTAGQHDNIVGLRGLAREGSSTYIVLEYCPRGTLDVMVHHTMTTRWDPKKVLQIIRGIARGVLHLHSRKPAILHRDLKPANVFISHGLVMKIGDFGMSRHIQSQQPTQSPTATGRKLRRLLTPGVVGTACYSAPEILDERLQSGEYNVAKILKADVYSFGVMMWEIVERKRPFEGLQLYEIVTMWSSDPKSMELEPFTVPKDLNPVDQKLIWWLQELTKQCTNLDPDRRPEMRFVVKKLKEMQSEIERLSTELPV
eukprot:g4442.t1